MANPSESSLTLKNCVGERVYHYVYHEHGKGLRHVEKRIELTPEQVANFRKTVNDLHNMDKNIPQNGTLDVLVELRHPVEGQELTSEEVSTLRTEFKNLAFNTKVPTGSLQTDEGALHFQLKEPNDTHIKAIQNLEIKLGRMTKKESFDYLKDPVEAKPSQKVDTWENFVNRHTIDEPGVDPKNPDGNGLGIRG